MNMKVTSRYIFIVCIISLAGSVSHVAGFVSHSQPFTHVSTSSVDLTRRNIIFSSCGIALNQSSRVSEYDIISESQKSTLPTLLEKYGQLTTDHYLLMAFLQAAFLASGADIATQTMAGANGIEFSHVAAMATVASTFSGAINAVWLRQLEQTFPGTATKEVAIKTIIHATIVAFIINSAYLVGVPLCTDCYSSFNGVLHFPHMDMVTIFKGWNLDEFLTLTKLEVAMFIPYNTLAFKFVPPQIRPLTHASISATFNVAVSAITLGYFNTWCERAFDIIP